MTVVDAARDGARLGSKGSASDSEIKSLVQTEMGRLPVQVQLGDITVERNVLLGPSPPSTPGIRVTVCYNHSPILPVPLVMPNPLRMCSTTIMPKLG
jgi:hypothetical protein